MMRAYRSILIVRAYRLAEGETDRQQYRRVLVPLDGSRRAECAVPVAVSLATAQREPTMRPQLVLGHVVRWPEMPRRTRMTEQDIKLADRLVERNREEISVYLHDLKAQLPVDVTVQVLVGRDVALALHELVDGQGSDLVIMSAHGHSGAHRWPYGSVATSMISYGHSPLLMIQDLGRNDVQLSQAEQMIQEHKGH
jgi:nucleotide-binding universal stress UspA family protein